jgi:antitoxin (DNA-binding transcriptional repressor) of toxin-antitoxin stability system
MKETSVESFSQDPMSFVRASQRERVLVTQAGKPLALLVGLENKDQEDWDLETSPEFWRTIQERRARPTVPLGEFQASLPEHG